MSKNEKFRRKNGVNLSQDAQFAIFFPTKKSLPLKKNGNKNVLKHLSSFQKRCKLFLKKMLYSSYGMVALFFQL